MRERFNPGGGAGSGNRTRALGAGDRESVVMWLHPRSALRRLAAISLVGVVAMTAASTVGVPVPAAVRDHVAAVHRRLEAIGGHTRWWFTSSVTGSTVGFGAMIAAELLATLAVIMVVIGVADRRRDRRRGAGSLAVSPLFGRRRP